MLRSFFVLNLLHSFLHELSYHILLRFIGFFGVVVYCIVVYCEVSFCTVL